MFNFFSDNFCGFAHHCAKVSNVVQLKVMLSEASVLWQDRSRTNKNWCWSWSWSCKLWSWWSGAGLKNLVLFK